MNTFTLLSLLITISVSLSKANHLHGGGSGGSHRSDGGGFTVELIHRDSPLSPLYNPTYDRLDRIQNAYLRSIFRASRFSKKAGFTSKIEADIYPKPGEYVMRIQIGNAPIEVVGIADTGSDLTWAQCQPCKNCYKQPGLPFLQPDTSSTYRSESCQSKACEALALDYDRVCSMKNVCEYIIRYGGGSYTKGDLANDTFWLGSTPFKNVVFGCGRDNNGTFNEDASGIVGLGGGPLSIINQLSNTINGKFSYCLVSALTKSSNVTGKIHFGDRAVVSGPGVVSTTLKREYVTLEHVSVGNRKFGLSVGDIMIDSGTTLTIVPQELHDELTTTLTKAIGGKTVPDPYGVFDLCYKNLDLSQLSPNHNFQFHRS